VVALPDSKHAGKAERVATVLSGLNEPHGLAFYEGKLYVAENDKVRRYDWDEANLRASNPQKLADLPTGGAIRPAPFYFTAARCTSPPDQVATSASKKIRGALP